MFQCTKRNKQTSSMGEDLPFKAVYFREKEFEVCDEIGRGAFGQTRVLTAKDGDRLAAKVVVQEHTSQKELTVWPNLRHENIVPLLGYQCTADRDIFIMPVYECTLHQILQRSEFRQDPSGFAATLQWLKDVARGVEYLHRSNFCHLDLKPSNVLIASEGRRALITDLGFTDTTNRPVDGYALVNFSPPESWNFSANRKSRVDGASFDVWTYGILALRCWRDALPETGISFHCRGWKIKEYPLLYKMLKAPTFSSSLSKSFPQSHISEIESVLAVNFVKGILRYDPLERPSARKILEHRILSDGAHGTLFGQDPIWDEDEAQAADAVEERVRREEIRGAVRGQVKTLISDAIYAVQQRMREPEFYDFCRFNKGDTQIKKKISVKKRIRRWLTDKLTATRELFTSCF